MLDSGMRSTKYHLGQSLFSLACQHPPQHLQGKEHVVGQILVTNQLLELRALIVLTGIVATAAFLQWLKTLSEYVREHTKSEE